MSPVLRGEIELDKLQVQHFTEAELLAQTQAPLTIAAEAKISAVMDKAAAVRQDFPLLGIVENVVESWRLILKPPTLVLWNREFLELGGSFERVEKGLLEWLEWDPSARRRERSLPDCILLRLCLLATPFHHSACQPLLSPSPLPGARQLGCEWRRGRATSNSFSRGITLAFRMIRPGKGETSVAVEKNDQGLGLGLGSRRGCVRGFVPKGVKRAL